MPRLTEQEYLAWREFLAARVVVLARVESRLAEIGELSPSEIEVLTHLEEHGGRLRMSRLAALVHASRSGLTRRVDRLGQAGLVRREAVADDRRGAAAVLTEAGRDALQDVEPRYRAVIGAEFASRLTSDELALLTGIFAKLNGG